MSDLISRQAAIDAINRAVTKEVARWSVKELPSAEVEPVKHGKWIKNDGRVGWHCSECGRRELDVEGWDYCPTCGAKVFNEKEEVEE